MGGKFAVDLAHAKRAAAVLIGFLADRPVGCDAGRAERVAAGGAGEFRRRRAALHHAEDRCGGHRSL